MSNKVEYRELAEMEKRMEIAKLLNEAGASVFEFYNTVLEILIEMHPEVENHPKFKEFGEKYKKVRDRIKELQKEIDELSKG
jgi:uncharacterized protein YydD (DUF2326 family)